MKKKKLKRLFSGLLVLLFAALAVMFWLAFSTVSRVKDVATASTELDLKYYRVSAQLRSQLHRLSASMLRFQVTGEPVFQTKFDNHRKQINRFLEEQTFILNSSDERELLNQISEGLSAFFQEAERAMEERSQGVDQSTIISRIESSRQLLDEIVELTNSLADTRHQSFRALFADYQHFVQRLQFSVLGWIAVMITLLVTIGWLAYRLFVTPLSQDLEAANTVAGRRNELATIGTLAAGIAHEIRNPITAMKARVFALSELVEKESPAVKQAHFIDTELNRLESLVRDFLDYARPSEPVLDWTDPAAFVQEMHDTLAPEIKSAGHDFILELGKASRLLMDTQQMRQIVLNLVRNASEACHNQAGVIKLGLTTRNGFPRIYVSDNGPGIPIEYQKKLFIPFFSKKASGTGLGLSIAENLARKNRAQLNFESSHHTGTTFFIDFRES